MENRIAEKPKYELRASDFIPLYGAIKYSLRNKGDETLGCLAREVGLFLGNLIVLEAGIIAGIEALIIK